MSFIQQIALALADELRQRYPLDEINAAPCFSYNLQDGTSFQSIPTGKPADPASPTHYNMSAIRDGKALFSISISGDEISVTIHKDQPSPTVFDDIENLPGVAVSMLLSKESDSHRFILAEPNCVENVLLTIDSAYPQERRDDDA
jgi:hypothetical protein